MKKHRRKRACDVTSLLKKRLIDQELTSRDFWICYAVYGVLTLIAAGCAFSALLTRRALGTWSMPPVVLGLLGLLAVAAFCFLIWRERKDPARVFALIALPAGLGFALLLLPDHVPDEAFHIYRVFGMFSGTEGLVIPAVLNRDALPVSYEELYWALVAPYSDETFEIGRVIEPNSDLLYLVPGMVALCLKGLCVNTFAAFFLARLANLALFMVAGYWALRFLPFGKVILCVYILSPMCLQQEASCSADALTNAASLLFVAYVLKLRFAETITKKQMGIILLLFAVVLLSKPAYFLLGYLLLLLVPHLRKERRNPVYIGVALVTIVGVIAAFLLPLPGTYGAMVDFVRSDPLEAAGIIANSAYMYAETWFWEFIGAALGNLSILPWRIIMIAYAFMLFSTLFVGLDEKVSFKNIEKVAVLAFAALFFIVVLMAFRTWSIEIDGVTDAICGFQGRYAIPVFILVMLAFFNAKSYLQRPNCLLVYSGCFAVVFFACFHAITRAF